MSESLEVNHYDGEWLLWLPSSHNPVDGVPLRFSSLMELSGSAPRLLAEERGDRSIARVDLMFTDNVHCPIGRHGRQRLRGIHRQREPNWSERAVEHIFTVGGPGGAHTGLHEARYNIDGSVTFNAMQFTVGAGDWLLERLQHGRAPRPTGPTLVRG